MRLYSYCTSWIEQAATNCQNPADNKWFQKRHPPPPEVVKTAALDTRIVAEAVGACFDKYVTHETFFLKKTIEGEERTSSSNSSHTLFNSVTIFSPYFNPVIWLGLFWHILMILGVKSLTNFGHNISGLQLLLDFLQVLLSRVWGLNDFFLSEFVADKICMSSDIRFPPPHTHTLIRWIHNDCKYVRFGGMRNTKTWSKSIIESHVKYLWDTVYRREM